MNKRWSEYLEPLVVLTTLHVTPRDLDLLRYDAMLHADLHGPYGFWLVVPNDDEKLRMLREDDGNYSEAFLTLLEALSNDHIEWLLLDRDGLMHPDFELQEEAWMTRERETKMWEPST